MVRIGKRYLEEELLLLSAIRVVVNKRYGFLGNKDNGGKLFGNTGAPRLRSAIKVVRFGLQIVLAT